jgi:hypothetical protein
MRYCILPAVLLLLAAACTQNKPADKATLILLNGTVWTADSLQPTAEAVALRGERILFVGDNAGAQAFASDSTQIIHLHGAFVTPGFIEGHGHFSALGRALQNLNLMPTKSWQEIVRLAGEKAAATPKGAWIEGRGWHQEKWNQDAGPVVNGYPFHDALSAATPDHPVVLHHASGHALLANRQAMERAGISRETPDPVGGRIVRDAAGRLTGVFEENAMLLIERPLETWKNQRSEAQKQADFDQSVRAASADCLSKGICSFQDAGSSFWEIEQYKRLAENGKLDLRLWIMVAQPPVAELNRLADFPQIGLGDGYCTVRAVKAYLDGALGSYGAWLLEPYNDKPGFTGQNVTPADTLAAIAAACRDRGLQFCVHAIGDRANRETLRIFEQYAPGKDARWRIEHAQHIAPEDIPRFAQQGVVASMQAIHCTSDAPFVEKRLGAARARTGAYVWRNLLDSGAQLANGTDTPVEDADPRACLYASVTRKRPDNPIAFYPEQAMSREEALLSYTRWNARAAFEENEKGSLEKGKRADVTVWSSNLLQCPVDSILQAEVRYTIVGGKIRFAGKQ